jgi:hypothetical protein
MKDWEEAEERMKVIAQNGNDGLHYSEEKSQITIEVTKVTHNIYKGYRIKALYEEKSVNGHIDITLQGEYNDLKRFCLSEHYTCGDTNEDIKNFFKNIKY